MEKGRILVVGPEMPAVAYGLEADSITIDEWPIPEAPAPEEPGFEAPPRNRHERRRAAAQARRSA